MRRPPRLCSIPTPLYLYYKRDGSITQVPDTADAAERGYVAIIRLLESGALRLSEEVRAAAHTEFTANRRLNRLFGMYFQSGRCDARGLPGPHRERAGALDGG